MVTISPEAASATTADAFCFSARTPTVFMSYFVAHDRAGGSELDSPRRGRAARTSRDDQAVSDYVAVNLANWNSRVAAHEQAYRLDELRDDPLHLSEVVRFDVPRLGSLAGLDVVHLQCHIGTDTVSLARLGARSVTGLDFSAPALEVATQLALDCGAQVEFVESELYGAVDALGAGRFDLVYTGIGALCWLPDIHRWAEVVAALLRPGGRLFIREGHPVLWSLADPRPDGLLVIEYPYFETEGVPFSDPVSYVEHDEPLASPEIVHFNHGLAEVITAVMDWRSPPSRSTAPSPGTRSATPCTTSGQANTACVRRPNGWPPPTPSRPRRPRSSRHSKSDGTNGPIGVPSAGFVWTSARTLP